MDDRVALITGGGRGIGLAISRRLAGNGTAVCLTDLDGDLAQAAAAEIERDGGRAPGLAGDVRSPADCEGWARAVATKSRSHPRRGRSRSRS